MPACPLVSPTLGEPPWTCRLQVLLAAGPGTDRVVSAEPGRGALARPGLDVRMEDRGQGGGRARRRPASPAQPQAGAVSAPPTGTHSTSVGTFQTDPNLERGFKEVVGSAVSLSESGECPCQTVCGICRFFQTMHGGVSDPSICAFIHRVAFEEVSGHRVLNS